MRCKKRFSSNFETFNVFCFAALSTPTAHLFSACVFDMLLFLYNCDTMKIQKRGGENDKQKRYYPRGNN